VIGISRWLLLGEGMWAKIKFFRVAQIEGVQAALILALVLSFAFFPVVSEHRTLLMSVRDAPSIMPSGVYQGRSPPPRLSRSSDPGAPAWTLEPLIGVISGEYWHEHHFPLWNPYAGYGTPLAAAMQPQPFFPLAFALSIDPTATTYSYFIIVRLLVAGLLMFFFSRMFFNKPGSLFSAITFMLTGYFINFLTMPHISVEILLPGFFLALELLLRRRTWAAIFGVAVVIFLIMSGGMPESAFLVVSFGYIYYFFRLIFARDIRVDLPSHLGKLLAATVLGFGLSAFLLFPFVEFMRIAYDSHQVSNVGGDRAGLAADTEIRGLVLYLLPLLFGPVGNSIFTKFSGWTGLRGYVGILPCVFGMGALFCWFTPKRTSLATPLRSLVPFFAASLTLLLLKRYGSPLINWIGILPISEMVLYVKYDEPLIAFCVAFLAGAGFAAFSERHASSTYFLTAALVVLGGMLALAAWSLRSVLALDHFAFVYYLTLLAGVLVILGTVVVLSFPARAFQTKAFIGLLAVELCLNFIVPCFDVFGSLPSAKDSPYQGAPYIDFLHAQDKDYFRVFGREGVLYPNWAGVFGLADVRSLDAMYYRRYLEFIRSFLLQPGQKLTAHGDLADRFTGAEYPYLFKRATERRFLQVSSIKYLISASKLDVDLSVLDGIIAQHRSENLWGFGLDTFPVGDDKKVPGLFQHPPSSRVSYRTTIDPQRPIFEAVATMKSEAQDKSDGVGFLLEIRSGGTTETLFSTPLNPRDIPADRAGKPIRIDLSRYAGQEVELLFSTDPGPSGNNTSDWAGWAEPRFVPREPSTAGPFFKDVYDREVRVYEVPRPLPRAAIFHTVEILPDADVLARLKDPGFDPAATAVLSRESLAKADLPIAQSLTKTSVVAAAAAQIDSYDSQRVRITAETETPALLMLTDSNYPGWQVYVNGHPASLISADYLFRGVMLPAGKSVVEFDYEPRSFQLGMVISAVSLVVLIAVPVFKRRRRGQSPPFLSPERSPPHPTQPTD
jgi:hypothetical protein